MGNVLIKPQKYRYLVNVIFFYKNELTRAVKKVFTLIKITALQKPFYY